MNLDTCRLEAVAVGSLIAVQFTPETGNSFLGYSKSAKITPVVSKGTYRELRENTTVAAVKQTPDILLGYDIVLTDTCLNPRAFAAADGGEVSVFEHIFSSYAAPEAGNDPARTPFSLQLFAAQKDENGSDAGYLQLSFSACTGCPASFSLSQGEFFLTDYTIRSRSFGAQTSMSIIRLSSLPFETA